jgi:hypothetical protein
MTTIALPETDRFERFAALDIETDGLDGARDHLVAIGVGFQAASANREVAVHTLADARGDEARLIELAIEWLDRREPHGLVTYNGAEFDLPFLEAKLASLGHEPSLGLAVEHLDLFTERQRLASIKDEKWPSLEEALSEYDLRPAKTMWYDEVLTNTRFAEELAPRYLGALDALEFGLAKALDAVIVDYTAADIEATMSLYEADCGRAATTSD